jgi:hypothetical protein
VEAAQCGFLYDAKRERIMNYTDGFNVDIVLSPKYDIAKNGKQRKDEIGKMLAELLNLIAKT